MVIGPGYPGYVEARPGSITAPWIRTVDSLEQCNSFCEAALFGCGENRPEHCDPRRSICESRSDATGVCTCCNEDRATSPMVKELCDEFCGRTPERRGTKTFGDETFTCPPPIGEAPAETGPIPYQFESITPRLEIPLPTLPSLSGFMDVTIQGDAPNRYLLIPWLGQYIAAIYKYAIGIVGILSGIMIVIGGLLWLTAGGAADRVSTAKSYIESSLVGLVIALTSFLLLYAINPKLTEFDSLRVNYIERATWENVDTAAASEAAASDASVPEGSRPIATSQQCDPAIPNCQITFSAPMDSGTGPGNPRALEFFQKMKVAATLLSGSTRFKVTTIASAAANCCVVFGSCGESNLRINYLAGVPQAVAGQRGKNIDEELKNNLGTSTRGIVRHSVYTYSSLWEYLDTMNCDGSITDCKPAEQIRKVYEKLRSGIGGGYPDSWADELQPGDSIVVFNANSSARGGHAMIFMGWTSRAGVANVIQGSPGLVVKRATLCLKNSCGLPFPFTSTYKPEP
ncbi:MAG: pilin [Patescibacteria group bacterium]